MLDFKGIFLHRKDIPGPRTDLINSVTSQSSSCAGSQSPTDDHLYVGAQNSSEFVVSSLFLGYKLQEFSVRNRLDTKWVVTFLLRVMLLFEEV